MQLKGIHHVTAITSSAEEIYTFFTYTLGLRLVKKTVNQDDIHTYHLFFADDLGSPGTDMTFFDFQGVNKAVHANDEVSRTAFRVPNDQALLYWLKRFKKFNVTHSEIETLFGKKIIYFNDFDDQLYALISDEDNKGVKSGTPWQKGPVPNEFAITGLGLIFITVSEFNRMKTALENIFNMRYVTNDKNYHLFEMGEGGNGASVILIESMSPVKSYQGYGGIHHIAFRVEDKETLRDWIDRLNEVHYRNSGFVDRFYFQSLYTRFYPNILFEIATDGPGFIDDEESYEILGEKLALPPKFRDNRKQIEGLVRHIDTTRSDKIFEKEYLDDEL